MNPSGIFNGPWVWTPESGLPLTNGPIDGSQFEASLLNCLGEYLHGYFTGSSHALFAAQKTLTFPLASLRFQQGFQDQPLGGVTIRTVLANSGTGQQTQYANQWRTKQTCGVEFYVNANVKTARADGWNSDLLSRTTSDCLYALLLDRGASIPLQANGFRRLRPQNPAVHQDSLYSTRRIRCSLDVWFASPASGAVDSPLGGDN